MICMEKNKKYKEEIILSKKLKKIIVITLMIILGLITQASAESVTIWAKATEIMEDLYNQILLISTLVAVVTASIALLLMNFSKNGRTVDESRSWLKRIIITWVILNSLGFIMAYITPFFADGKWSA